MSDFTSLPTPADLLLTSTHGPPPPLFVILTLSPVHLFVPTDFTIKRPTLSGPSDENFNWHKESLLGTVNALHDYIICLILLPVNAPMVNCQDELSLHLLQEEAQAPGGSLSGIMLLPVSAEPNRRPWAKEGDCMPCWAVWLRLMPRASCCFRALFLTSCQGSA